MAYDRPPGPEGGDRPDSPQSGYSPMSSSGDVTSGEPAGESSVNESGAGGYSGPAQPGYGSSPAAGYGTDASQQTGSDQSARYSPPPGTSQGGTYASDQGGAGSSYTPPPAGGGYSPPPSSAGGGYAPPPPPSGAGEYGVSTAATPRKMQVNGDTIQYLFNKWFSIIRQTKPSPYEEELPNANWISVWIAIAAVTIVTVIAGFIGQAIGSAAASQMASYFRGNDAIEGIMRSQQTGGPLGAIIFTPLGFFIGAGILYISARLFGGQPRSFLDHAYLLSLNYAPLRIIGNGLSWIPVIGGLVAVVAGLYQIYHAGISMQVSQRLAPGRAQLAAWVPTLIGVVAACLCAVTLGALLAAAISGAVNSSP